MKRNIIFLVFLAVLSVLSGVLMAKASWIGRVGMTFFYKEYNLLKIWWQGAIAVFIIMLVLFILHSFAQKMLPTITARLLNIVILIIAAAGLYFTYDDFHTDLSHRLLGWRFHFGFYLGWIGWMLICLFFAFKRKHIKTIVTNSDKTVTTNQ